MLGTTHGAAHRRKPGVDEVSGTVLSCGSFEDTWVGNLECEGTGEGDILGN